MSAGYAAPLTSEAGIGSPSEPVPGVGATPERLLLREFSHRVNNELASAIGLVAVAATRCESNEARAALASLRDRLESYAHVHRSLQMPDYITTIDLAAYLRQLCRAISQSKLEREGIALSLSLQPLGMNSERCWLLGMIVSELITNAARHAFRGEAGALHLEVWPAGTSVRCCVTDNGTSDEDASRGRGLSIVEALAASLHGTVDVQFGSSGTKAVVSFPLGA